MERNQPKPTNPTMAQRRKWTNSNQRSKWYFIAIRPQSSNRFTSFVADQKTVDRIRWNGGKAAKAMQSSISQRCTVLRVRIVGQPFSMCFGLVRSRMRSAKNVNWQRPIRTIRTVTVRAEAARTVALAVSCTA